jgi:hypothetical protein
MLKGTRFYTLAKDTDDYIENEIITNAVFHALDLSNAFELLRKGHKASYDFVQLLIHETRLDREFINAIENHYLKRIEWAEHQITADLQHKAMQRRNSVNQAVTPDIAMKAMRSG